MSDLWRIDELQALTAAALATTEQDKSPSGRVRAVPDSRTIRYYTTLGLIDRPAEMRGRTAWYGRRHVLQLVCIKRLQAQGLPLAEVQRQLAGATMRRLSSLAALPPDFWEQAQHLASDRPEPSGSTGDAEAPARREFWGEPVAASADVPQSFPPQAVPCVRLPISSGVTLEIAGLDLRRLSAGQAASLAHIVQNLSHEVGRLGLRPATASSAEAPHSSPDSSTDSSGESPCS